MLRKGGIERKTEKSKKEKKSGGVAKRPLEKGMMNCERRLRLINRKYYSKASLGLKCH